MSENPPVVAGAETSGTAMHALLRELYPICRSITGDGVRATLARLQREIPLQVHEVPSGTPVFDWTVPSEWNIRDAWVANAEGERVIDFRRHNLHVVNYSIPVRRRMSLAELRTHLHTLPEQPDLIPYRTSYYKEDWGFCLPHRQLERMAEGDYDVCIDASLREGSLTYGECVLPGESDDEVLVSAHVCHPSLADDNLSGVVVATWLARQIADRPHRLTYRFLFIPGTIGAITWLARNEHRVSAIRHGLVLTCVGDRAGFTYKRSRRGDATIDVALAHVLKHSGRPFAVQHFSPYGYDERQYCSPGFDLPVGCLMRSVFGQFREYHTSADNPGFVDPASLDESLRVILAALDVVERNGTWRNLKPKCEPQLGRRGLYDAIGGVGMQQRQMAMLWVLNQSDGHASLLDIAEHSGLPFTLIADAAQLLHQHDLLAAAQGR